MQVKIRVFGVRHLLEKYTEVQPLVFGHYYGEINKTFSPRSSSDSAAPSLHATTARSDGRTRMPASLARAPV